MPYFPYFKPEELAQIVPLAYRAGIWISHIDDVEGTLRDNVIEHISLENALKKLAVKLPPRSFMAEIVAETLNHPESWDEWADISGTVLTEIERIMPILRDRLPAKEVALFRRGVFHIARAVAMAVDERGGIDDWSKMPGGKFLMRLIDRIDVWQGRGVPANISAKERDALKKLLQCLKG